ncbi:MAG: helix-turn-helix domain-containing protein [Chitinophagales bacterium]
MKTTKNVSNCNTLKLKSEPNFMQQLQEVIAQQITDKNHQLAVEHLAEVMHITKKTLERKIKAHTQQTAKQYLHEFRLQYAHQALEEEAYTSTQELATSLGYSNASHLALIFKKRFGYTPKALGEV